MVGLVVVVANEVAVAQVTVSSDEMDWRKNKRAQLAITFDASHDEYWKYPFRPFFLRFLLSLDPLFAGTQWLQPVFSPRCSTEILANFTNPLICPHFTPFQPI